ncbi:fibronectin type III domain-containing protein [Candidatus Omnitrophota bacterium]
MLINDQPIDFYEDGSFKLELDITIGLPEATLNNAIYDAEFVIISGTVNLPSQTPSQVKAIAEDLAGNKSMEIKREVNALNLEEYKVTVNDSAVDLENGAFRSELILEQGLDTVAVLVYDSLGRVSEELKVPIETTPPILEVNQETYAGDTVTVSGKASDELSGLDEILINNTSIDFSGDGAFSQTLPISESTVTIVALDRAGNMTGSIPITVSPPDTAPPLFVVGLNPVPATIGNDLSVTIDVLDSKTRQPEMLDGTPVVNAVLSDGQVKSIEISGSGASFYGALSTTGLPTGLITLTVEGKDTSGNLGNVKEGLDNVLLNTIDTSAPSFSVSLTPAPPAFVGAEVTVNAASSETLKSLPNGTLTLPDGISFEFALEGALSGTSFTSNLSIPAETIPGTATLNLTEAVDLADNAQTSPTVFSFEIEPEEVAASLPLRIEFSEITNDRIAVKGLSSPQAIIHITLGEIKADIPADDNGLFHFIKPLLSEDLELMRTLGASILLDCHATNYAGLISEKISLNIPLPAAIAETRGGENFLIDISPYPIEQGQTAQFDITSRRGLREAPNVSIRLSNGRTELVNITGSGRQFQGIYQSTPATAIGPAIIQIKSEDIFESRPGLIVPSSETYAAMAGSGFFTIIANPDPLPMGKELDVSITAERAIKKTPSLEIRLPNGRLDQIIVSGEGSQFNGKYLCPQDIHPGPAELIVNMGQRSESRRPFGIAPPYGRRTREGDVFTFSNPRPMATGSSATVTVKSRHPLEEIPGAQLLTSAGKLIPIELSGSTPGHLFNATIEISSEVSLGPAVIIIKDQEGNILDEHPTEITPGFGAADMEVEALMVPSPATPNQVVMINVNSLGKELNFRPRGKLIFSDGLITPLNLEGPIPAMQFRTPITIPQTASLGPVNIMILDAAGLPIGGGQAYISRTQRGGGSGELKVSVMPPNPLPGDPLEVSISSDASLQSIRCALEVPGKGPQDIRLEGPIPGNRFRANISFPRDAQPRGSRIDVFFDRGAGEETQSFFLEGRHHEGGGHRPPELNPFPPMPGKPLVITLHAPFIMDFAPSVRVNYITGNESLATNGPIPGDRFTGTLPNVAMAVTSIDVLGPGGELLVNLPIEMLGGRHDAPHIQIMPLPLMPGSPANLRLEFPRQVYSLPTASIKLETGRMVPITLTGPIPGSMFTGMFSIPHDTSFGPANLEVYIDNQLVPGGTMPVNIGDSGPVSGDLLALMIFPGAPGELNIDWHLLPRAERHKIECQAPGLPKKTFDAGRRSHYFVTGLEADSEYKVTVIAFDSRRREITRSEYYIRTISSAYGGQGFPLYVHPSGPGNLQINWDHQPGVLSYNLFYVQGANDPLTQTPHPAGNATSYHLYELAAGQYQIQVEAMLSTGETMLSEIRTEYVSSDFDYGRPPVELHPYPPITGQPLDIDVLLPMTIPVLPSVKAQYATAGEDAFTMSGPLPGSSFHGTLASVKDTITAINFYDPISGGMKHSHPIGGDLYYDITPYDLWVRISVDPEPAVGTETSINLDFNQEVDFQHAGLRLLVGFVGGREIEIPVSSSGPQMSYQAMLSATQHSETIETIGIEGSRGMVPEEYINTQASGGITATLSITPDPPIMGTNTQIQVSIADAGTYQPRNIDSLPAVGVDLASGTMWELTANGSLPGSEFSAELTQAMFTAPIELIDVEYNGVLIASKTFVVEGGPVTFGPMFYPDPPQTGQPLNLNLDIPPDEPPMSGFPEVKINYASGTTPASEYMEISGALPGRHFNGLLPEVKGPIVSADFINPLTGTIEHTYYFTAGSTDYAGGTIDVAPNDPPLADTAIEITYHADRTVYQRPIIEIHYLDNSMEVFDGLGPVPGMTFNVSQYITKQVTRIEAWNLQHSLIFASRHFAHPGGEGAGAIAVAPDPHYPPTTVAIQATTDYVQSNFPFLKIFYWDNSLETVTLAGDLPGTSFSVEHYITKDIERIELLSSGQAQLAVRYFHDGPDAGEGTIAISPDPAYANTTVTINVTTDNSQPGLPILKIFYSDNTVESTPPVLTGELPGTFFTVDYYTLKTIVRIEALTPSLTNVIAARDFYDDDGGQDFGPTFTPDPPVVGEPLSMVLELDPNEPPIYGYPIVRINYVSGTSPESEDMQVSGAVPGRYFEGYLSEVKGLVETAEFIDPISGSTEHTHYFVEGIMPALIDASPTLTINPDPPIMEDSLQVTITTTLAVRTPIIEIIYLDGDSFEPVVSGADPGMNFTATLSELTKPIDKIELISGMNDPQPDELVETFYLNLGSLPYPTNVWLEAGGLPTEVFVNWDSVSEADGYFIYYSLSEDPFHSSDYVQVFEKNITREIVSGLSSGETYYFVVSAYANDGRESGFDMEESWVVGSGTAGEGSLTLTTPAPLYGGDFGEIDFGNVSQGTTSDSETITVQNTGTSTATIRAFGGTLLNVLNPEQTIPASNVNFTDGYTIAPSGSESRSISVSVPSGTASGDYLSVPGNRLILYDDLNGNGSLDSGESFVKIELRVTVGVEGLDAQESGIMFNTTAPGTTTATKTIHVENTSGGTLANIQLETNTLYKQGNYSQTISSSNIIFSLNSAVAGTLGVGETTSSSIYVSVPANTIAGDYGGAMVIYNDTNYNSSRDNDEPFVSVLMMVPVSGSPDIGNLSAVNRGTGGTVDLTWTDSDTTTDHYHVYYRTSAESHVWGSPDEHTFDKAFQVTGLTDNTAYYFVVRAANSTCTEDTNTTEVSATPTTSGADITPPTFAGIASAFGNGEYGQVVIEFFSASDASTPISYSAYYGTDPNTIFDNTPVSVTPSSHLILSLQDGTTYYFAVRAKDYYNNEEKNTRIETAIPYGSADHIAITSEASSSAVGSPVLVKVTAYSSADNSTVDTSFTDSVKVYIEEAIDYGQPRCIVSLQDRVSDDQAEVAMVAGEGYFTIDAVETTTVEIFAIGLPTNTLSIDFTGAAGSGIDQFAIEGASSAMTGTDTNDGALIWISALDSTGKVLDQYLGEIDITVSGAGSPQLWRDGSQVSGSSPYRVTYTTGENSEMKLYLKNAVSGSFTVSAEEVINTDHDSNDFSVSFYGVDGYLLESAGQYTISAETIGSRIKWTAYSVNNSDTPLSGYNGQAEMVTLSGDDNNSAMVIPSTIQFVNGIAEFYVENSEYETVTFKIQDISDNLIDSDNAYATFTSTDTEGPDLIRVEAETPFLLHLYFSEAIDSDSAFNKNNYGNAVTAGNIDKICWYEDEVTLHLGASLNLGQGYTLTVYGTSGDEIKDGEGNYMGGDQSKDFTVPNVDYQGSSYGGGDWLEIQVSPANLPTGSEQTVHVIVYHKNACGYLTGANAINRSEDVSGITLVYGGDDQRIITKPSSSSMGNGVCEFDITIDFDNSDESVTITAEAGNVTSGEATIEAN